MQVRKEAIRLKQQLQEQRKQTTIAGVVLHIMQQGTFEKIHHNLG
jgi:hypothetical protein